MLAAGCGSASTLPITSDSAASGAEVEGIDSSVTDSSMDTSAVDTNAIDSSPSPDATPEIASDGKCAVDGATCVAPCVALSADGPWNESAKCWATSTYVFECVAGIDGGTAFTCFFRISTSQYFLAPSTHIPSGTDYRYCTDAERSTHSPFDRCKAG